MELLLVLLFIMVAGVFIAGLTDEKCAVSKTRQHTCGVNHYVGSGYDREPVYNCRTVGFGE